jgi:hypothetical protein
MNDGRDNGGRFAHGNALGKPFGPNNPPPRSPGRPKKGAWLRELEDRVKDPRIRQGLADRLLKIALKGRDADALKALHEIQDRTGEPIALRIDGMSEEEMAAKLIVLLGMLKERLPPEFYPILSEVAHRAFAEDEEPWLLVEHDGD